MIPKQPPSRLEGGNWSQPLRDFVSYCLNELPEDRMSAEELQKTKLIKASKNIATSCLRDLVNRMEIWSRKGGIRNSLIGGPDGFDMMSDMLGQSKEDEYVWDFDVTSSETGYTKSRSNTLTSLSSRSNNSFDELDDAETVKPRQAIPGRGNVPPLPTGTDHPLLQLFAGRGIPASQTQGALQPGFQPTVVPTNGSSTSLFSPTTPRPASPDLFPTIEIPSFDDMSSSSIIIPELPDVPTIPMQIEIPSLDEPYSMRPLPLLPPTSLPSAAPVPAPINIQTTQTVPPPPFSPLPRSFQAIDSVNSERSDRQTARGQRPDNAGMLSLNKTSDEVVSGIMKSGPSPIRSKMPLGGIKISEASRSTASPVPSSPARTRPSLDMQNTFKQSDIPQSSSTPIPPSPARSKHSINRDPSPRRLPATASAPSSPPRGPAFTHAMPPSIISNTNVVNNSAGLKSFHLPSKSVPTVSTHRDMNQDVPPIPNIGDSVEMRSAESTPNSRQRVAQEIRPITPNMINLNNINGILSGGVQSKAAGGLPMSPNVNPNVNSSFPGPYGHASSTSLQQAKTHNVMTVHPPQSSQTQQTRSFGSKRSDLSLKLPPSQFSSFDIGSSQRMKSPRFPPSANSSGSAATSAISRPPLPTPSIFTPGLRTPRPTDRVMLPQGVEYDRWGMPTKFSSLNQRVLAPGTSSSEVSAELDRMLGLLGAGLDAMINGFEACKKPGKKPQPSSSSSLLQPQNQQQSQHITSHAQSTSPSSSSIQTMRNNRKEKMAMTRARSKTSDTDTSNASDTQ